MPMSPRTLRPRQTGFDPRSISGLLVWLDASNYNALTGSWSDASGNGRTFSQGVANNRPIISATTQNGRSLVEFDGTNDQLQNATNFLQIASCTLFAAFRRLGGTFGGIISSSGGSDRSPGILIDNAQGVVRGYLNFSSAGVGIVDTFNITSGTVDNGTTVCFINGTQTDSDAVSNALDTTQTTTSIGTYRQAASNYFSGYIGEILAYNRVLTVTELKSVENYLGRKFNVTVA
jgi:hypothetical protein